MITGKLLYTLYRFKNPQLRRFVLNAAARLERGEFYSATLRAIFKDYHRVEIGMYSYGGCFTPGNVDPLTTIGRYCNTAYTIRVFNRNHPCEFKSMHAFFFNSKTGYCDKDLVAYKPLTIGHDVWMGYGSVIVPAVCTIGTGSVIAAGSIVTKDVPPYAIVAGNPARILRYRFPPEVIEELLASRWWDQSIEDIRPVLHEYQRPYIQGR